MLMSRPQKVDKTSTFLLTTRNESVMVRKIGWEAEYNHNRGPTWTMTQTKGLHMSVAAGCKSLPQPNLKGEAMFPFNDDDEYTLKKSHEHDWEIIEVSDEYEWINNVAFKTGKPLSFSVLPDLMGSAAVNRVCVLCGKCDAGIESAKKEVEDRRREAVERKVWAKRLWEDGCK